MRFLRLDFDDGRGSVDLHPFLTVVAGLDTEDRDRVLRELGKLGSARPAAVTGLVEDGGLLLEIGACAATRDGAENGAGARRVEERIEISPLGPFDDGSSILDFDQQVADAGTQALLQAELDQAHRRAQIDAVRVEEARNELRPGIAAALRQLEAELARAKTPNPSADPVLLELESVLDDLRAIDPTTAEIGADVDGIRSAWQAYELRLAAEVEHLASLDRLDREVSVEVDDARHELDLAEAEAEPRLLSAEDETRLEDLANRPVASGRLSLRAKPSRTPDEEAELADLLAQVDQPTYSAYVMYRLRPTPTGDVAARLESARTRLRLAHDQAADTARVLAADPVRIELDDMRRAIESTARTLMGPVLPSDLGAAIENLVVNVENPAHADQARRARAVLAAHHIEVPEEIGSELLADWMESWIHQRTAELAGWELDSAELAGLEAEVERTRQILRRHEAALLRIDRLESSAASSLFEFRRCEAELDAALRGPVTGLADALVRLRSRLDATRHEDPPTPLVICSAFADLADVEIRDLFDVLIDTASSRQVIVVSDHPVALAWTSDAGLSRAILSKLKTL